MKSDVNEITKACQGEGARVSEDPERGREGRGRIAWVNKGSEWSCSCLQLTGA